MSIFVFIILLPIAWFFGVVFGFAVGTRCKQDELEDIKQLIRARNRVDRVPNQQWMNN